MGKVQRLYPYLWKLFNKIDRCVMGYHESEYEEYLDECGQKVVRFQIWSIYEMMKQWKRIYAVE